MDTRMLSPRSRTSKNQATEESRNVPSVEDPEGLTYKLLIIMMEGSPKVKKAAATAIDQAYEATKRRHSAKTGRPLADFFYSRPPNGLFWQFLTTLRNEYLTNDANLPTRT